MYYSPQVLRSVFRSVVGTSLKAESKNHTILMRKIAEKEHKMFPHGEAILWSQKLEPAVATCISGIPQTY